MGIVDRGSLIYESPGRRDPQVQCACYGSCRKELVRSVCQMRPNDGGKSNVLSKECQCSLIVRFPTFNMNYIGVGSLPSE